MLRIQKASKKIANHLFCAVTPINDKKKNKIIAEDKVFVRILKTSEILACYKFFEKEMDFRSHFECSEKEEFS